MSNANNGKMTSNSHHQSMTWLEAFTKITRSLAWPLTIFVLVVAFRHELTAILNGITTTKVEYPGGSITVQLNKIQEGLTESEPNQLQTFTAAELAEKSLIRSEGDLSIALLRIRFDLEQELFRPSEIGLSPPIEASRTASRRIDDLVEAGILDIAIAHNIREFLKITSEVSHGKRNYLEAELGQAVDVGASLVTEVRRRIVGAELEHHFRSNLLWHHVYRPEVFPGGKRSAVAKSAPDFEYDYDLYEETTQRFNLKEATRAAEGDYEPIVMEALTLDEFVQVLEFREQEIMRVLREERKPPDEREEDYHEWKWPPEWGGVGWTGPVLRDTRSADFDLEKLRHALATYRRKLHE